mgnify:CR=1 FL=1
MFDDYKDLEHFFRGTKHIRGRSEYVKPLGERKYWRRENVYKRPDRYILRCFDMDLVTWYPDNTVEILWERDWARNTLLNYWFPRFLPNGIRFKQGTGHHHIYAMSNRGYGVGLYTDDYYLPCGRYQNEPAPLVFKKDGIDRWINIGNVYTVPVKRVKKEVKAKYPVKKFIDDAMLIARMGDSVPTFKADWRNKSQPYKVLQEWDINKDMSEDQMRLVNISIRHISSSLDWDYTLSRKKTISDLTDKQLRAKLNRFINERCGFNYEHTTVTPSRDGKESLT